MLSGAFLAATSGALLLGLVLVALLLLAVRALHSIVELLVALLEEVVSF